MGLHKITARVWQEGGWWIAQAIEVNVASQGKSKEEARSNLQEALELYLSRNFLSPRDFSSRP